jgi:predicted  nucleic acid-binding Zn-ribbon protein
MFWFKSDRVAQLDERCDELVRERDALRDQVSEARGELADFKRQKQSEEDELKHGLKMERERDALERLKFEAKLTKEKDAEVAQVKDQYRDKMENELRQQIERAGNMYSEILARLPNISAKLTGKV